jgi:Zn-dependent peptidase ImmA (M78 family)
MNKDGSYNIDAVKKLRRLTAHELGHIALQTKELLEDESTQGTILLSNGDIEREADFFAEELLRFRREWNKRLFESGNWKEF